MEILDYNLELKLSCRTDLIKELNQYLFNQNTIQGYLNCSFKFLIQT